MWVEFLGTATIPRRKLSAMMTLAANSFLTSVQQQLPIICKLVIPWLVVYVLSCGP
jgi:hypothetical protein